MSRPVAVVLYRGRASNAAEAFAHLPPDGRALGYFVTNEISGAAVWREKWGAEAEFVRFCQDRFKAIEDAVRETDRLRGPQKVAA